MVSQHIQPLSNSTFAMCLNYGHARPITHNGAHSPYCVVVQRLDDHTVITNTPWFDGNRSTNTIVVLNTLIQHITLAVFLVVHWPYPCHSVHHQWLGKRGVVHAMCCHSTPFTLVHPFALLTHSVSFALTLCQTHSAVNQ